MTPKFTCTPGRANSNIIDYKTKAGQALYKRVNKQINADSERKFALTSDGLLMFVGLLTGHYK